MASFRRDRPSRQQDPSCSQVHLLVEACCGLEQLGRLLPGEDPD